MITPHDYGANNSGRKSDIPIFLEGYDILEIKGEGTTGIVYKARHIETDRTVALKVFHHMEASAKERLRQKSSVLSKLEHPNIVKIYEMGSKRNVDFCCMEWIEGHSLSEFVKSISPSIRQSLDLIIKIAEAVQHAHEHGIIHGNLNSSNILIDGKQKPMITDFGIAAAIQEYGVSSNKSTTDMMYLAPESRGNREKDEAGDVYSLGAILYEMLYGRPPALEGIKNTSIDDTTSPTMFRVIPKELENVCHKAMKQDKSERYESVISFVEVLKELSLAKSPKARQVKPVLRPSRTSQQEKSPRGIIIAASVFVVLLIIGFLCFFPYNSEKHNPEKNKSTQLPASEEKEENKIKAGYLQILTPDEMNHNQQMEVTQSINRLLIEGKILGKEPLEFLILNGRKISLESGTRQFRGEIYLDYGNNSLDLLVLYADKSWLNQNWQIIRRSSPESIQNPQLIDQHKAYEQFNRLMSTYSAHGHKKASLGLVEEAVSLAISIGAPVYDRGDVEGCYRVYLWITQELCSKFANPDSTTVMANEGLSYLKLGLYRHQHLATPDQRAWTLRMAFDQTILLAKSKGVHLQEISRLGTQYCQRGLYYEAHDAFSEGCDILREIVAQNCKKIDIKVRVVPMQLAAVQLVQRKFKESAQTILDNLGYLPELPNITVQPHNFNIKPEHSEAALKALEIAAQRNEADADLQFLLGYEYFLRGRKNEANLLFHKVLRISPSHAGASLFIRHKEK